MDNLINYISSGVGAAKKKSRKSVLIRLGSKRTSDVLLSSDSSDEEYLPDTEKRALKKPTKEANQNITRKKKQKKTDARKPVHNPRRTKATVVDASSSISPESSASGDSWSHHIPDELLLRVFQIAIGNNEHRLKLLICASKVCRLWRRIACDPTLWHNLDLSYGWIVSPLSALESLAQEGRLVQLRHLNVSGSKKINKEFIQFVVSELSNLKSLNVSGCNSLRAEGLRLIANELTHLEHFSASGISVDCKKSIEVLEILKHHREKLKSVELASKWNAAKLLPLLPTLTKLTLLDISEVVLSSTTLVTQTMKSLATTLQVLRMSRCTIQSHKVVGNQPVCLCCPQLTEFTAAEALLTPSLSLSFFVRNAPRLKHLDLRGWSANGLDCINELDIWPALQTLNIRGVILDNTLSFSLSQYVVGLQELDISWLRGSAEANAQLIRHILNFLEPKSNLRALYCAGTTINITQLRAILGSCPSLHTIDLESCRSITRGLKRLHNCQKQINALRKTV